MKLKAMQLDQSSCSSSSSSSSTLISSESGSPPTVSAIGNVNTTSKNVSGTGNRNSGRGNGSVYQSIVTKLQALKPSFLDVEDESRKHAGHVGNTGKGETHFKVNIIADCFESLNLVQRHKIIYTLLNEELKNGVHALSINAKTSSESK
jgi:stress-induced morphogen